MFKKIISFYFTILCFSLAKAQKPGQLALAGNFAKQELNMAGLYTKLQNSVNSDYYDSTEILSANFTNSFVSLIKSNAGTLTYSFKKLKEKGFYIMTSADGNFRVYSWDTWTGGTMHFFKTVYQWRANGNVYTKEVKTDEGDPGGFCSDMFTINVLNKKFYLPVTNGIYSSKDASQSISVFTVIENALVDTVKLFHTKTKQLNLIGISYDFFSVADRPERPVKLITYDEKLKILYIPVVNDKAEVTTRNILYRLTNSYFEFIGIEVGKRKKS